MTDSADHALFTISYAGDFEMCRALCASVDRLMPERPHYLVVDRVDAALFAPLATGARRLIVADDVMREMLQVTFRGRRWWLTPYGPPVRGWIYQQLVKMAVVASLPHRTVTLIDSDAIFVRPLDPAALWRDGRARLFRAPGAGQGAEHVKWHRVARRVLGLPDGGYTGADYISTGVTWRPEAARMMLDRIAATTRLPWRMALSWRFRFSEYILYGVFCEHAPGPQRDMVFFAEDDLCHGSWHYDLETEDGRRAFAEGLAPHHAVVLIQSNLRLDPERRRALLAAFADVAA